MLNGHAFLYQVSKANLEDSVQAVNFVLIHTLYFQCSVDCGKGTQVRTVFCAGKVGGKFQELPDDACLRTSKPTTSKLCGNNSCQPQWFTSQWGEVHDEHCTT